MRILNYQSTKYLRNLLVPHLKDFEFLLLDFLKEYYPNDKKVQMFAFHSIYPQLFNISYVLEGQLEGKIILDLGCGNNDHIDCKVSKRGFEPWLCRSLKYLGANPIGIDINNLEGEAFTSYSTNLGQPNCLNFIPDHSIDLANASYFFDSPHLNFRLNLDPIEVKNNLLPQLERILKPNAPFLYPY